MVVVIEIDGDWCGIGFDRGQFIHRIRLGWVAVAFVRGRFGRLAEAWVQSHAERGENQ